MFAVPRTQRSQDKSPLHPQQISPQTPPRRTTIAQSPLVTHFHEGDLLYGLQDAREPYFEALSAKVGPHFTPDRYNNVVLPPLVLILSGEPQAKEIFEALSPAMKQYGGYLLASPKYTPTKGGGKGGQEDPDIPRIRRACKAAITWQPEARIHFCLDGIDLERVVSKQYAGKTDLSFTASELRYLYRNWKTLQHRVLFYYQGQATPAPWVEKPELWCRYQPKSQGEAAADVAVPSLSSGKRDAPPVGKSLGDRPLPLPTRRRFLRDFAPDESAESPPRSRRLGPPPRLGDFGDGEPVTPPALCP